VVEELRANAFTSELSYAPAMENLKAANWRLAVDMAAQTDVDSCLLESRLPAVERIPAKGRGKPSQFVPVRFVFTNKLGRDEKLAAAFDALVLSKNLGREVSLAKVIHGDERAAVTVKTSSLVGEVQKHIGQIAKLLSNTAPPDLVLNRHCAECEFQARCRKIALEKDDLSLLAGMGEKERQKLGSKGIFTVTQLSYTFRPRHRPKRLRDKREKYHHSLKALAIREKKIHIVGTPELKIEGTPVYIDVEGVPDRDFYYLIGARYTSGRETIHRSFWADDSDAQQRIWKEFLAMLASIDKPTLIHYGSFETVFFKVMQQRYREPAPDSAMTRSLVNVLSVAFGQVYFPTYSNGLKEIGGYLDFHWSDPTPSGLNALTWRLNWEQTRAISLKERLLKYNAEDCAALEQITQLLERICSSACKTNLRDGTDPQVVLTDQVALREGLWGRFTTPIADFDTVNSAARWDYQRERIYLRTNEKLRRIVKRGQVHANPCARINREFLCTPLDYCPVCQLPPDSRFRCRTKILYDIRFSRYGLRRWLVKYRFRVYWCPRCHKCFGTPYEFWPQSRYGRNLVCLIVYQLVALRMTHGAVAAALTSLFGLSLSHAGVNGLKSKAAHCYIETRQRILAKMISEHLIHADETPIILKHRRAYVWVFATFDAVVYYYAETREGGFVQEKLKEFKGVLVSDFYSAYESVSCPKQRCLIHLIRDLNDAILDSPYDEELKQIVVRFGGLLRKIVTTVDRWGLRRRFLNKHHTDVDEFYQHLRTSEGRSEAALKIKERFVKNEDSLFTFLNHDGVPWNNNNAEHAIKAFAKLRHSIVGMSTPSGIEDYLILLSVRQTCKYSGLDFLDFLRSGEKDIEAFAHSRRGRKGRSAALVSLLPVTGQ
jgi:predicted RecB family nuclease